MVWLVIIIILVLGLGSLNGVRRGALMSGLDLAATVLSIVGIALLFSPVAHLLELIFKVKPNFAPLAAAVIIWAVVRGSVFFASFWIPPHQAIPGSAFHRAIAALFGLSKAALTVLVILAVISLLPLNLVAKQPLVDNPVSAVLLKRATPLVDVTNKIIGPTIDQAIEFLTIKPNSDESLKLGYTTTNVAIDEASENTMLTLVNQERTSRGLSALTLDPGLRDVARAHSRDMFARGYFAHIDPDGHDPFARLTAAGIHYQSAGENLALAPEVISAHKGLMNSPGHRANILDPSFHKIGIGVIDAGRHGKMFSQDFTD